MKYQATIELKDDKRCDGCLFLDENSGVAHAYCRYGEFHMDTLRDDKPQDSGIYSWHTPRPRGCPLKPMLNSAETAAELLRRMKEIQSMPQSTKDMYDKMYPAKEVEK